MAISIFNLSLSAKYFGVSLERDIWILTLNCIVVIDMALWGAVNETFRAKFVFLKQKEGLSAALSKARSLMLVTVLICGAIVLFAMLSPQSLGKIIAPAYSSAEMDALCLMIFILAPSLLFNQLNQIITSILNAYDSFFIPEIASCASVLLNLFLLLFLAPLIGIYSLVYAYYIGLAILICLLLLQVRKLGIPLFAGFSKVRLKEAKPFILFAIPFFIPYFFGQVSLLVEKSISSSLSVGTVSIIEYSRKFSEIALGVIGSVLTTMLVPVLSSSFSEGKPKEFVQKFLELFQLGFLLLTLIVSGLTMMPEAIVDILYDKGHIDQNGLSTISAMVVYYGWAIPGVFLYLIFGMSLLSSGKGKTYAFFGSVAQLLMILINVVFVNYLKIITFPLSFFASHLLASLFLMYAFPYRSRQLIVGSAKYIVTFLAVGGMAYTIHALHLLPDNAYLAIISGGSITVFLMLMSIYLFRLEERRLIESYVAKFRELWSTK